MQHGQVINESAYPDTLQYGSVQDAWGGKLHDGNAVQGSIDESERLYTAEWRDSAPIQATIMAVVLILLFSVRKIISIMPSLLGAFIRVKENFNIEDSLRLRRNRNQITAMSAISITLIYARYKVLPLGSIGIDGPLQTFAGTIAFFLILWGYRYAACMLFSRFSPKDRAYRTANGASYTYFTITVALSCVTAFLLFISGTRDMESIRTALLITAAVIYSVYLVREIQIFIHSACPAYIVFLYLCSLELLPAAAIVACILL